MIFLKILFVDVFQQIEKDERIKNSDMCSNINILIKILDQMNGDRQGPLFPSQ